MTLDSIVSNGGDLAEDTYADKKQRAKADFLKWVLEQGLDLTPTEREVLNALYEHCSRIVQREQIIRQVWGATYIDYRGFINQRGFSNLKWYMSALGQKLKGADTKTRYAITSFNRLGYMLSIKESERNLQDPLRGKPLHEAGSVEELYQILWLNNINPKPKSAKVLHALLERSGHTVPNDELCTRINDGRPERGELKWHVSSARKLVRNRRINGFDYQITSYYGIGYRITHTVAEEIQPRSEAR